MTEEIYKLIEVIKKHENEDVLFIQCKDEEAAEELMKQTYQEETSYPFIVMYHGDLITALTRLPNLSIRMLNGIKKSVDAELNRRKKQIKQNEEKKEGEKK